MADTFDAILIWQRHGQFAVMSPQLTTTNSMTLLKYTQLSELYRFSVANGTGVVGRCMLGDVRSFIFRHVNTMCQREFARLNEARDCSIRSLCFVKLSHDLVAELVNMDEKDTHNMAPVVERIATYLGVVYSELANRERLQTFRTKSLLDLDHCSPGSPAASDTSDNAAWDLLCCGELNAESRNQFTTLVGTAPMLGAPVILDGTPGVQTDEPHRSGSDRARPWNGEGTFSAFAVERPRSVRLKRLAQSAREVECKRFRELADSRDAMQLPRNAPATLSTQSLATMMQTLMDQGDKRVPALAVNAIVYQLTRAIAHANGLGVCHRDVCPANIMIQMPALTTQLTGWVHHPTASSSLYAAPELFMSPESVIMQHMKADVWSLGMVLVEALRGSPLISMENKAPLAANLVLANLIKALGSPSEAALKALDPAARDCVSQRVVRPQMWHRVLRGSPDDPECAELLGRMLDWNPATREPAASLLGFPYFDRSRAESCKYKAATQCKPTAAEIEAQIPLASAAHARRSAAGREVAAWMPPHQSPEGEPLPPAAGGTLTQKLEQCPQASIAAGATSTTSSLSGVEALFRLITMYEDPLETVWRHKGLRRPSTHRTVPLTPMALEEDVVFG